MGTNPYGYTPEDMKSVGDKLVTIQGEIGEKITAAKTAVDGLIDTGFTSAVASGTYSEQFLALSDSLKQVNENMGPLGEFLKSYADSVEKMDTDFGNQLRG